MNIKSPVFLMKYLETKNIVITCIYFYIYFLIKLLISPNELWYKILFPKILFPIKLFNRHSHIALNIVRFSPLIWQTSSHKITFLKYNKIISFKAKSFPLTGELKWYKFLLKMHFIN